MAGEDRMAFGRSFGHASTRFTAGASMLSSPLEGSDGGTTLYSAWGNLHSGGAPVYALPRPLPGDAGKAGWFEITLRAENNYLFLGPSVETRSIWPPSDRSFSVVYRLDLPPDSPVVYAGSLYLECVYSKQFSRASLPHLSRLIKNASESRMDS